MSAMMILGSRKVAETLLFAGMMGIVTLGLGEYWLYELCTKNTSIVPLSDETM